MGNVVHYVPDTGNQGINAIQHVIKSAGKSCYLVGPCTDGNTLFKISFRNTQGCLRDFLYTLQGVPAHEPSCTRCKWYNQDHDNAEYGPEYPQELLILFQFLAYLHNKPGADHAINAAGLKL